MIHKKNDFINNEKKHYICIAADKDIAVFAKVKKTREGFYTIYYKELFATGQKLNNTLLDYSRFYRGKEPMRFPNPKNIEIWRQRTDIYLKNKNK